MKILHTSHRGLPDHRIERSAEIARRAGHSVSFLGLSKTLRPELKPFDDVVGLRSINNRQAALDKKIRREWAETVQRMEPDLIHANDIIAAKFSSELGYPMVYDDHEYWSAQLITFKNKPLWKRIAIRPYTSAVPRWESDLLSKFVTITVSEGIAKEHRKRCDHVFVLRNFNLQEEVCDLPRNTKRAGVAYVGGDYKLKKFVPHRNLTGLRDALNFDVFTGLSRQDLYGKLIRYRFGLMPFRSTPYSKYISSAKTFDYLNCGLQVLMMHDLYESHGKLPYTYPVDSYSELRDKMMSLETVDPNEIMDYAHKNLVWKAQENKLFEAYKIALSL